MARRVLVGLARVVVSLALVATSLVLHLPTRGGRAALRDIVAGVLPGPCRGASSWARSTCSRRARFVCRASRTPTAGALRCSRMRSSRCGPRGDSGA